MNLFTSAEWPQIDCGEWQWGTEETQGHNIIRQAMQTNNWSTLKWSSVNIFLSLISIFLILFYAEKSLTLPWWKTSQDLSGSSKIFQDLPRILEDMDTDPSRILEFAEILKEIDKDLNYNIQRTRSKSALIVQPTSPIHTVEIRF